MRTKTQTIKAFVTLAICQLFCPQLRSRAQKQVVKAVLDQITVQLLSKAELFPVRTLGKFADSPAEGLLFSQLTRDKCSLCLVCRTVLRVSELLF